MNIPLTVIDWIRTVFRECDERVTSKLCNNPNIPEEGLDMTWIDSISQVASPHALSGATVELRTHYIGGLRHFNGWEVADIGLLLFIRAPGEEVNKVALLQSKRLYPTNDAVREEHRVDYETGFARLADPEDLGRSLKGSTNFEFTPDCRYGALIKGSDQMKAIKDYYKQNRIPIFYQLYNPWNLPFSQVIPLTNRWIPSSKMTVGTLVVPSNDVTQAIKGQADGYRPRFRDFLGTGDATFGWKLETFIADKFLGCEEGLKFADINDNPVQNLFYRRSGPIAAAISISIDLRQED
jgi:hypothetical protein